ncbi:MULTISPECIES: hypothetical protein [Acinetobacter]|uniref:hypothetical protein n=1 Tax=Acinetobacter TaxID=469 RepID=UPI0003BDFD32|nr:hypothetical protein [Acinetobacter gyllenbergii]ESK57825.1 hypothetical protein F987_00027 [Acinetobacter gyllenbergii NIPH 230]
MKASKFNEEIFILNIPPNMYGKNTYYKLKGEKIEKCKFDEVKEKKEKLLGFYFTFYTWSLQKKEAALFIYNNIFILFYQKEYIKITPNNIKINSLLNFKKISINLPLSQTIVIKIFTPPFRYLNNDGSFPEMVEPFSATLESILNNYTQKIRIFENLAKEI